MYLWTIESARGGQGFPTSLKLRGVNFSSSIIQQNKKVPSRELFRFVEANGRSSYIIKVYQNGYTFIDESYGDEVEVWPRVPTYSLQ